MVESTTMESHGHTLGVVTCVMRLYCAACKAGGGMCYHRWSLLWKQHNHWGEGRPTPRPTTALGYPAAVAAASVLALQLCPPANS